MVIILLKYLNKFEIFEDPTYMNTDRNESTSKVLAVIPAGNYILQQ
jgi:hypothetical protein